MYKTLRDRSNQTVQAPQVSPLLRPFFPALDGLRAISFLLVFSFHYVHSFWQGKVWEWGWVGVDMFFAISGFLITGILYNSLERENFFRNFYTRRALRVFPLFYGFWICVLLLTPVLHVQWNKALATMPLYIGNFFVAGGHLQKHSRPDLLFFALPWGHRHLFALQFDHFWTLCVEEQFYLVWPAVIFSLRSRRALLWLCIILLVALPIGRTAYMVLVPGARVNIAAGSLYYNTFSRADSLLAGAVLALALRSPSSVHWQSRRWALFMVIGAPCLLLVLLSLEAKSAYPSVDPVVSTIGYSLIAIASVGGILLAIEPRSKVISVLTWRPLVFLGRISYGMYLFHLLPYPEVALIAPKLIALHLRWTIPVGVLTGSLLVSWLSFRFVEGPILRLKPRLAPRPGAVDDPPPNLLAVDLTPEEG